MSGLQGLLVSGGWNCIFAIACSGGEASGVRENLLYYVGLSVAHEPAGSRAGLLAILKGRRAGHECRAIAVDPLHEAAPTGRQIVHDLRLIQTQPIEIDQVDIGAQSGLEPAAILKPEEIGG